MQKIPKEVKLLVELYDGNAPPRFLKNLSPMVRISLIWFIKRYRFEILSSKAKE
jgi:hypothetical protein